MYDVVDAKYIDGYEIEVTFENGRKGIVNFEGYAEKGGVFGRLAELEYLKDFHINRVLGVLSWRDEVDIAPEALYHEATGEPFPEWIDIEGGQKAV